MARVLLVLLVHFEANPFNAPLLHFVLVTSVLTGGQGGGLAGLVHQRLPAIPLELCGLGD